MRDWGEKRAQDDVIELARESQDDKRGVKEALVFYDTPCSTRIKESWSFVEQECSCGHD